MWAIPEPAPAILTFSGSFSRSLMSSDLPALDGMPPHSLERRPLGLAVPCLTVAAAQRWSMARLPQYEAAALQYYAALRNAVRDVETALVNLYSAQGTQCQPQHAVQGFEKAFRAANAKYRVGMGSMLQLESARRNLNTARQRPVYVAATTRNRLGCAVPCARWRLDAGSQRHRCRSRTHPCRQSGARPIDNAGRSVAAKSVWTVASAPQPFFV